MINNPLHKDRKKENHGTELHGLNAKRCVEGNITMNSPYPEQNEKGSGSIMMQGSWRKVGWSPEPTAFQKFYQNRKHFVDPILS